MSSKKRKLDEESQQPSPKKQKLNNEKEEDEYMDVNTENNTEDNEYYETSVNERFYDMLCNYSVSELLDPLCGGVNPTNYDLDTLKEMESFIHPILTTIRKRKQYISKQNTIKRNNLLDSFISIHESKAVVERDSEYPNDYRKQYEGQIIIGQANINFEANWYSGGFAAYGYVNIENVFKFGRNPNDIRSKAKMYYYNVINAVALKDKCKNISGLLKYEKLSNFDWIVEVVSLIFEVLCRHDKNNWMVQTFGSEWIPEELYTWKNRKCVKEKNECNGIINYWIRMNKILN
eukprot:98532_1